MSSKFTGHDAEVWVAKWLSKRGWDILKQRYRFTGFEVDIIALRAGILAGVEVKFRSRLGKDDRSICELASYRKRNALTKGVKHFLTRSRIQPESVRIDLAVLSKDGRPDCLPNACFEFRYYEGI